MRALANELRELARAGADVANDGQRRAEQQAKVEPKRPATCVRNVHLERLPEGRAGARRDLPEAGQPRRHQEPFEMVCLEVLRFVRNARAWSNQGHISAEDVDE